MIKIITAPTITVNDGNLLFLAGGITDCPDWQMDAIRQLSENLDAESQQLTVLNPRRNTFDITKPEETEIQIRWEYYHLAVAKVVLFWFPKESVCPIALYELGRHLTDVKKYIYVGCDYNYSRREDLLQQLPLAGHNKIHFYLEDMINSFVNQAPYLTWT